MRNLTALRAAPRLNILILTAERTTLERAAVQTIDALLSKTGRP